MSFSCTCTDLSPLNPPRTSTNLSTANFPRMQFLPKSSVFSALHSPSAASALRPSPELPLFPTSRCASGAHLRRVAVRIATETGVAKPCSKSRRVNVLHSASPSNACT
eukprot:905139-Rhodomonas_salina.3